MTKQIDLTLNEILDKVDNLSFFKANGLNVIKQSGKNCKCICPFCGDKKFNLNHVKGLWKCNSDKCNESGNQITFYAKVHGVSKGDAVKEIKKHLGIIKDEPKYTRPRVKVARNENKHSQTDDTHWETQGEGKPEEEVTDNSDSGNNNSNDNETGGIGNKDKPHPYHRLVELTRLTPDHREELKKKRGFIDETINTFMFRSGGEYLGEIIRDKLCLEYSKDELVEVGILKEVNGTLLVEEQLLGNRVLIPYLDENRRVYHLRPHKLGFKGIPVEPYCRFMLKNRPKRIILTEGEFKDVALYQWGIPGIAGPGTSSFAKNNIERLIYLLKEFGVEEIVIIYDSEDKSNPDYSNFKEQVNKRYDTQFWSYVMAHSLYKEGFKTSIGWLPAEWRVGGKIDFDQALALGKTKEDIEKVIACAKTPREFLDSLDEDGKRVVQRKITKFYSRLNIKREFNKYVIPGDEKKADRVISNFVINIKSNFFVGDSVIRNVELINEYGESSDTLSLDPGAMAGLNEFKKFILSRGNYIFEGNASDLMTVWKFEFLNDNGELIYMPEQIGWIERHKVWLFGNMAFKDGKTYRPDNDGIIWIDGKGFKPQSLSVNAAGAATEDAIPALYDKERIDIKQIAARMKDSIGGFEAYVGIGWIVATIFSRDIFAKYKCVPILFPHGKRESGKSTLMRWLMQFFGVETEGVSVGKTTTANFIARALSYYSCIGAWFDEYRNEAGVIEKDGLFRSAYNRQLSGKGTATAFQAKGFAVHSSIAISGEELPKDNGLFTRLIPLQISSYKRNREHFDWMNKQSEYFSGFVFHLITNYDKYRDKIMTGIAGLKKDLVERGITDRTAENWAICAAAFEATVFEDDDFILWVENTCQSIKQTGEQEHMLNQFWQDLSAMVSRGDLGNKHFAYDNENLYIWTNTVYPEWCMYFRKKTGKEPFDKLSILQYLQDEPYFRGYINKRIKGTQRRVHAVDINGNEYIQEIAATLEPVSVSDY